MRPTSFRLPFLSIATAAAALELAFTVEGASAQSADLDLFAVSGAVTVTNDFTALGAPDVYTISGACLVGVDVAPDESGCTTAGGGGTLDVAACSTGTISGSWQVTEAASDVATVSGTGVMVGGVAVIPGGFQDDTVTGEAGALVGVFTQPVGTVCGMTGGNDGRTLRYIALLAGEY